MAERPSQFKTILASLKKRHILETFAGFIAGGWLFLEFVDRILIAHYELNKRWLDVSFVTLLGALLGILLWRWFQGTEKRPGNVKVEVLLAPLIILVTLAIDLNLILRIAGIPGQSLLIGIIAFSLGVVWVIFKLSQWAIAVPESGKREVEASSPGVTKPEKSIVVLPFADLSPQKDQEYFCDGMTEEIIADLSCCQGLLVISRSSAMTLKRSSETVREIADKLNVRYALEGSVRKAGNDLRITAQLIDAATDTHVWAEKYSGRLDDIFDIQQKVSRSIVGALRVQLTPKEEERMMKRPIADVAAYDYYLRARAALLSFTEEGVVSALNLLESGLKVMGDNALIYAGLGYAHVVSFMAGMPSAESLREATVCAEKAINLDPSVAQGHVVLGMVQASNNVTQSFRRLTYALTIDPGNYDARFWLMKAHWCVGRCPAGREIANLLIRLDPLNPMHFGMRSDLNFYDGRLDLAIQDMSPLRTAQPTNPLFRFYWAFLHIHAGRIEEALAALEPVESVSQPDFWTQMSRVLRQVVLGDRKGAYALLTRGLVASLLIDAMNSCYLATIYALLDDDENTLDCLDNAVKLGFINYPYLSQHDRFLAKLRGEPRFQKLMERVKYEWENFEE